MRSLPIIWFLSCLSTACVDTPELDEVDREVTQGTITDDAPWAVHMRFANPDDGMECSGIVLTSRWALTAGHCVDFGASSVVINATVPGGSTGVGRPDTVYSGPVQWRKHPDLDFAVVHLSRPGSGIDLTKTGQARIYNGVARPWEGGSVAERTFDLIGWGLTNQSPNGGCQPQVNDPPLKFKGALELDGNSSAGDARVHADSSVREGCSGDSGGPWVFTRNNIKLAFALHKGPIWVPFDHEEVGILLLRLVPWMVNTSAEMSSALSTLSCFTVISPPDSWHGCSDGPPPSPPPPGDGCPGSPVCCEPGTTPGTCFKCRPTWGLCE